MAKTARNTIKTWFETGDFPTQTQFWNWLDSFWHKDDAIPTSSITDLDDLLAGKATTEETDSLQTQIDEIVSGTVEMISTDANIKYTIPAGKLLEKIVVIPTDDLSGFGIGTQDGGFDIYPVMPVGANAAEVIVINKYGSGDTDIWFNGITSQTTIKIYLR